MSWIKDIQQDFTIQTGDGALYTVFWNKASKTVSWHGETFSFIGIRGQLTKKEEAMARQFPMEFYFQGEDHLFDSQRFENSLNDKKPILISHPLYGNITAYVLTITFDNSDLNVTKINLIAIETIVGFTLVNPDPISSIMISLRNLQVQIPFELENVKFTVSDGQQMASTMEASKRDGIKIITIPDEANTYTNAFNTAITYVNTITATPIIAISQVCNFISLPGQFQTLVNDRIKFLKSQLERLKRTVQGNAITPAKKKAYEIQSASNLMAMCVAAVTPIGNEYNTANDVLTVSRLLYASYFGFIDQLDILEVSEGGPDEYFVFSADINFLLSNTINTTLSNLLSIALNGKQERFVYTSEDSNAILLAHRYYGQSDNDVNLQYFVDTNNLGTDQDQLLQIKKGTKIVYYN